MIVNNDFWDQRWRAEGSITLVYVSELFVGPFKTVKSATDYCITLISRTPLRAGHTACAKPYTSRAMTAVMHAETLCNSERFENESILVRPVAGMEYVAYFAVPSAVECVRFSCNNNTRTSRSQTVFGTLAFSKHSHRNNRGDVLVRC